MRIKFETQRLRVDEVTSDVTANERSTLVQQIPAILTPLATENLPPYFHGITNSALADAWLDRMLSDARLLQVKLKTNGLIGFLFAYVESEGDVHIGYLLTEKYWGQGLASELLHRFIAEASGMKAWSRLIGGVDASNAASARLLEKLGFVAQSKNENDVVFYEYTLPRSP